MVQTPSNALVSSGFQKPRFQLAIQNQGIVYHIAKTLAVDNFGGFSSSRPIHQIFISQPSYFPVQYSQSTNVLSAKMLIGCNLSKFSTTKVLCHTLHNHAD